MTFKIVECDDCGNIIGFIQIKKMKKMPMFDFICKKCHDNTNTRG